MRDNFCDRLIYSYNVRHYNDDDDNDYDNYHHDDDGGGGEGDVIK